MIQLTSKLDFKLTKKRFQMMGRTFSKKRARLSLSILLPILFITTFVFCTKTDSNNYWLPEYRLLYSNTKPPLYKNVSDQRIYSEVKGEKALFTGTAKSYDWQTDLIKLEWVVENGHLQETSNFNTEGNLYSRTLYTSSEDKFAELGSPKETLYYSPIDSLKSRTIYTYTGPEEQFAKKGSQKEILSFDSNGELHHKQVFSYPGPGLSQSKLFFMERGTEILIHETSTFKGEDTLNFSQQGYFENGNLRIKGTVTVDSENHTELISTKWDEEGNILEEKHEIDRKPVGEINKLERND